MTDTELELKHYKALQRLFGEKMGPWIPNDRGIDDEGQITFRDGDLQNNWKTTIRLPLPIDPVNPERGLWGMVDWMTYKANVDSDGRINIFVDYGMNGKESISRGWQTPTLALLKALCSQEGVTV